MQDGGVNSDPGVIPRKADGFIDDTYVRFLVPT